LGYLSTLAEVIDEVLYITHGNSTDRDTRIHTRNLVNRSLFEDIQELGDLYFLEASSTISLNGSKSYSLPSDFRRIAHRGVRIDDWVLDYKTMDWLDENDPDWDATGDPLYYTIYNDLIWFWPIASSGTVYIRYYKKFTPLTDEADSLASIPAEWRQILVLGAAYRELKRMKSPDAALYKRDLEELKARLLLRNGRVAGTPSEPDAEDLLDWFNV